MPAKERCSSGVARSTRLLVPSTHSGGQARPGTGPRSPSSPSTLPPNARRATKTRSRDDLRFGGNYLDTHRSLLVDSISIERCSNLPPPGVLRRTGCREHGPAAVLPDRGAKKEEGRLASPPVPEWLFRVRGGTATRRPRPGRVQRRKSRAVREGLLTALARERGATQIHGRPPGGACLRSILSRDRDRGWGLSDGHPSLAGRRDAREWTSCHVDSRETES